MSEPANVGVFDNIAIHSPPPELTLTADITDPQFASLVGQPGFLVNGGFRPNLNVSTQQSQADAWLNTSRYMPAGTLPYAIQWNLGSNTCSNRTTQWRFATWGHVVSICLCNSRSTKPLQ